MHHRFNSLPRCSSVIRDRKVARGGARMAGSWDQSSRGDMALGWERPGRGHLPWARAVWAGAWLPGLHPAASLGEQNGSSSCPTICRLLAEHTIPLCFCDSGRHGARRCQEDDGADASASLCHVSPFPPRLHSETTGQGTCENVSSIRHFAAGDNCSLKHVALNPRFPARSQPATLGPRTQCDQSVRDTQTPAFHQYGLVCSPFVVQRGQLLEGVGASSSSPQAARGQK